MTMFWAFSFGDQFKNVIGTLIIDPSTFVYINGIKSNAFNHFRWIKGCPLALTSHTVAIEAISYLVPHWMVWALVKVIPLLGNGKRHVANGHFFDDLWPTLLEEKIPLDNTMEYLCFVRNLVVILRKEKNHNDIVIAKRKWKLACLFKMDVD